MSIPANGKLGQALLCMASIQHRARIYVRGDVHTNTIEPFGRLLKRGIMGTYHDVTKKYLPLYLNEFSFRFNNRKNAYFRTGAV